VTKRTIRLKAGISILVIVTLVANACFAQDTASRLSRPVFAQTSLFYDSPQSYGLSAGIDWPYKSIIKTYVSANGSSTIRQKERFFGLQTSFYRYPYNSTGVLLVPTIGSRHYVNSKFFYETTLGIGVLRTFYDGKVYAVDASGTVTEKSLFGRFYATTHLASSFNFLLQKPGHKILALQVKPSLWFQYPFESLIKPHISLEAGIKYEINNRSTITRKAIKHSRK
jgi:hypothetical protein